jgi:hypothetical protein
MGTAGIRRTRRRFTLREMLGVIWSHGDGVSRALAGFTLVGYALPALPALWLFLGFPREVEWTFGLVWLTGPLYLAGFNLGVFTSQITREAVRRGWMKPNEAYYLKLAEYLDHYGRNGRNPGDVAVSAGFWILWYSLMGFGVLFSVAFLPFLEGLTPYVFFAGVNLPVTVVALLAQRWRTHRNLHLATLRGYKLEELFPGAATQPDVAN